MFNGLHEKVVSINGIFRNLETKWEICEVRTSHAFSDSPFLLSLALCISHGLSLLQSLYLSFRSFTLTQSLCVYLSLSLYLSLCVSLFVFLSIVLPLCTSMSVSLISHSLSPLRHLDGFLI